MKLILFVLFAISMNSAMAMNKQLCNEEYLKVLKDEKLYKTVDKIVYWQKQRSTCKGDGLFEYRLSLLYSEIGKYDEAKRSLKNGLMVASEYKKNLLFELAENEASLRNYDDALKIANQIIEQYPDWEGGYELSGKVNGFQDNFQEAIQNLEHALSIKKKAQIYSFLVANYYLISKYEKAAIAMQTALSMDSSELGNRVAIPFAAMSLIELKYFSEAEELLIRHQEIRPESERDSLFVKAVMFLQERRKSMTPE